MTINIPSGKLTWLAGKWTWIEHVWALLKMVIFQPAMLVYRRVIYLLTIPWYTTKLQCSIPRWWRNLPIDRMTWYLKHGETPSPVTWQLRVWPTRIQAKPKPLLQLSTIALVEIWPIICYMTQYEKSRKDYTPRYFATHLDRTTFWSAHDMLLSLVYTSFLVKYFVFHPGTFSYQTITMGRYQDMWSRKWHDTSWHGILGSAPTWSKQPWIPTSGWK